MAASSKKAGTPKSRTSAKGSSPKGSSPKKSKSKKSQASSPKAAPPQPSLSTNIHCLRSLPWAPSPILSLCPHPSLPLLAVSRRSSLALVSLKDSLLPLAELTLTHNSGIRGQAWLGDNLYVATPG